MLYERVRSTYFELFGITMAFSTSIHLFVSSEFSLVQTTYSLKDLKDFGLFVNYTCSNRQKENNSNPLHTHTHTHMSIYTTQNHLH